MDDLSATGVFYYEFFRESKKLRELVAQCRKAETPAMLDDWPEGHYVPMGFGARELIAKTTKGGAAFERIVQALVNCLHFPESPALKLADQPWLKEFYVDPAVRLCGGDVTDKNVTTKRALEQLRGSAGIKYRFRGSFQAREFESVFPVVIDWRNSNSQIIEGIRRKVLIFRPDRFAELAKGSPKQNPLADHCSKLPFRIGSALHWLGVLRRRNALSTWREFFAMYQSREFSRGAERAREADYRKARLILDWLESGTPLKRQDFK